MPTLAALETGFDALPAKLQKAARYVADHPSEVAVRSMRLVAQNAGVAPATMLRLAAALGFADYQELRDQCIVGITGQSGSYRQRAVSLQSRAKGRSAELAQALTRAQADAVESALAQLGAHAFRDAAAQIAGARRVAFLGLRASHAVAFYFYYVYGLIKDNGTLLADLGGTFTDQLENLGPQDCLVATSVTPYTLTTVQAAQRAIERGVPVVAITDSKMSPIARGAAHRLLCATEAPSFFSSMAGAIAVVEQLAAQIAAAGGKGVLNRLRATDARLKATHAYWDREWTRTGT